MIQMAIQAVGDKKIPIAVAIGVALFLLTAHQWAEINFVTTAQAEQNIASLSHKVDANGALLRLHIDEYKLGAVTRDIQTVRDQQYDLIVMVDQNGESQLSRKRTQELNNRLADLEKKERCIIAGNKLCQ